MNKIKYVVVTCNDCYIAGHYITKKKSKAIGEAYLIANELINSICKDERYANGFKPHIGMLEVLEGATGWQIAAYCTSSLIKYVYILAVEED